jgi:CDP-diacylglycerol--glycerol-3-phosphate 3-phosphatidyltransferase
MTAMTVPTAEVVDQMASNRVLTVPNFISIGRILLVPVLIWAVVVERSPYFINALLVVIGVSDFLDGWIARHFNQVTELGKLLDPIGDRLAVGTALALFLVKGWMPLWLGVALIVREVGVSIGAVVLGALGVPRFDVTFIGKLATLLLMFGIPFFTIAASDYSWREAARYTSYAFCLPGLVCSYLTVGQYAVMSRRAWPDRRVGSDP